ncbi:cell wall protein [Microlunatus speluncae]|uniref:cell wall protein n=1 Tax=Microlunatus speluncae TaxID=2594267 RepID=UPI001FEB7D56|nr:cell wall protein [Microlunatus speluncae]
MATPTQAIEIPATKDPTLFARSVAEALFAWDTASGLMPVDHTAMILRVGDPTGTERAGLASDIANYLPSRQAWIELRKYATRQRLSVQRSYVPEAWTVVADAAPPGQIQDGTTAITIEGHRRRDGVWGTEAVTSSRAVAFTVFVVCGPTYEKCHLLRLSQLDLALR